MNGSMVPWIFFTGESSLGLGRREEVNEI